MISVLIPVFNRNVVELVAGLQQQADATGFSTEIIVMDDASTDQHLKAANRQALRQLNFVKYIELPVNAGRNMIRHRLAAAASNDTFIFLDADSQFTGDDWLLQYARAMNGESIIMGGRLYRKARGGDDSCLHLHYGTRREQQPAVTRNRHPYRSFLACNFLITRQQFAQLVIDPKLRGYCHEDTFMGLQFDKLDIPVQHIDNPVYHEGIDGDAVFIQKQEEALINLLHLYQTYHTRYDFGEIKLTRVYQQLLRLPGGKKLLDGWLTLESMCKIKALRSYKLFWLDCWKIIVYHRLSVNNGQA